ncbi:hypothetical protein H4R34_001599 [Dimargaris verticillata]|uniref:Uncharacterized protein n=1 Tax=Dimargaris verticillata TaxID=2761393 RepID=A0A9W8B4D0_9FUNG|nr:hypothetical protein H4R34_001599 [Dimargaris verticillata]
MAIHVTQVHKTNVTKVPNALPHRESLKVEIFGMEGIPPEDMMARQQSLNGGDAKRPRTDAGPGTSMPPGMHSQPMMPPGAMNPYAMPHMYPMPPPHHMMPHAPYPYPMPPQPWGYPPHSPYGMPPHPYAAAAPPSHPAAPVVPQSAASPITATPTTTSAAEASSAPAGTGTTPSHPPAELPAPKATSAVDKSVRLLYPDSDLSVEEKRAALDKYAYDVETIHAQAQQLDSVIESRLAELKGTVF